MSKILLTASLLVAASLTPAIAQIQVRDVGRDPDGIDAQGSCSVQLEPDHARLILRARRQDAAAARAANSASSALNAVARQITALHLADASVQIDAVRIDREDSETPDHKPQTRYTAHAGLELDTTDIAGLARAVDAAVQAGIDEIAPVQVYVSPARRARAVQDCLPKAAADAQAQASAALSGLGLRLGGLTRISNISAFGAEMPASDIFGAPGPVMFARSASPASTIQAGPRPMKVTLSASFHIAPAPEDGNAARP